MVPTITSIVPSIFFRVIGKLKNGSGIRPNGENKGKTYSSPNSHNTPPMKRNPNNLISRSTRRGSFSRNFLLNNSSKAIKLAVLPANSDKTKPNRKCSSTSSSDTIGYKNRKSRITKANSKNPTETSLLSDKIARSVFHIFSSNMSVLQRY